MAQALPEAFITRMQKLYKGPVYTAVLSSFSHTRFPSFRINTIVTDHETVCNELADQGFMMVSVPWYKDAYVLKNKSVRDLIETDCYQDGKIYIQNLSSMIPSLVLNPTSDELILDLTAAPGSKTTQLAALMQNTGEIVANDISRTRLYKLKNLLNTYRVTNVKTSLFPGEKLWQRYPEYFDHTLLDAPCSMEGRIRLDMPDTYTEWSIKKVKLLSTKQKYLLRGAIAATKVGGTIVYSTCTLSPEENEAVIDWVLKKEGDSIVLEQVAISSISFAPGLMHWEKKTYDPTLTRAARIVPSDSLEGFFIAKIKKIKPTVSLELLRTAIR